jgi:hypothetical protein
MLMAGAALVPQGWDANSLHDHAWAGALASFVSGGLDGAAAALNPLNRIVTIPSIGAMPEHESAYGFGQVAGTVAGIGAQLAAGNIAAGGLGACGTTLQTVAQGYSKASAFLGMVNAGYHIADTGKVDVWDGLAFLPLLSWGVSKAAGLGGNCFVAGTGVVTQGATSGTFSTKAIQDIAVGDEVASRDQNDANAPLEFKKVVRVFAHTVTELEDVVIRAGDGTLETIKTTAEHPFYVDGAAWTGASHLVAGEHLKEDDGREATVVSTHAEAHPDGVTVYNFEVEGDHTYFVEGAGATSASDAVWVHNTCISINGPRGIAAQRKLANDLRAAGYDVVTEGALVRTAFGRREIDVVVRLGGELHGVEVKSGGAFRGFSQAIKDWHINNHTATFFGAKADKAGIGAQRLLSIVEWLVPS